MDRPEQPCVESRRLRRSFFALLVWGQARRVENPNAIESGPGRRRTPPCRGGASAPPRAASGRFERMPPGRRPSWPRDAADAGAALFRLSCFFHSIFLPAPPPGFVGSRPGRGKETGRPRMPPPTWVALGACGRPPRFSAWVSAAPSGRRSFEKPPAGAAPRPSPRIAAAGARRAQQATEERTRHGFHQSDRRIGRGHVRRPVD